jgi:threonine synthase
MADNLIYSKDIIQSFVDFFKYCDGNKKVFNGFLSTNYSYFQGLATTTYEMLEQMKELPDYIIVPCASGGNVVATAMAIDTLKALHETKKDTKVVAVQIEGGDPIKQGFAKGEERLHVIPDPVESETIFSSDTCFNYHKIYNLTKEGKVLPLSVTDEDIKRLGNKEYSLSALAGVACYERHKDLFEDKQAVAVVTAK